MTERFSFIVTIYCKLWWVVESMVIDGSIASKYRARLVRMPANRDYIAKACAGHLAVA